MTMNVPLPNLSAEDLAGADPDLLEILWKAGSWIGDPGRIVIHRLKDPEAGTKSQHYWGKAADLHVEGLSVVDQFVLFGRFPELRGLGCYGPDVWRHPGVHVDIRPASISARWGRIRAGARLKYVALDSEFFQRLLRLETGGAA